MVVRITEVTNLTCIIIYSGFHGFSWKTKIVGYLIDW